MNICAAADALKLAISQASGSELDRLSAAVWEQWGAQRLTDDQAQALADLASRRRVPSASPRASSVMASLSRFKPRRRQTSPDREASKRRRRGLARSAPMPAALAACFTEAESAALAIVAGEVKHRGACELPIDQIAALSGVCRTSVQNALHEARRLGLIDIAHRPQKGRKHLPNRIEIVSPEWSAWIKRGPTSHRPIGSKRSERSKNLNPTKSQKQRKGGPSRRIKEDVTSNGTSRAQSPPVNGSALAA
ncbi:hypothetical protein J2S76_002275 [Ancylobacter vacuolatus]|uniref:Helix-turn-helix domain-containing protein n=1 Tax=Ancylobacter vacuolatus TaxID=223389 RepID=A0ABU0DHQ4_9HYPH|nr:hypothetical protein [Ancylobacter vacuolatus]